MMVECRCPMCKVLFSAKMEKKYIIRPWVYCKLCIPKVKNKASDIIPIAIFVNKSEPTHIGSE